jgi:hypothetical protein
MSNDAIPKDVQIVRQPLVIMFVNDDGKLECHIHPPFDYTHEHYGLLVCDLVRHIAGMFNVPENKIWHWVEKERRHPTDTPKQVRGLRSTAQH